MVKKNGWRGISTSLFKIGGLNEKTICRILRHVMACAGGLWQRCAGGSAIPGVGIGLLGVSFAFGLTVLTMAYAVGGISGGHFNSGCLGWPGHSGPLLVV